MEELSQLEQRIEQLLARLKKQESEIGRLEAELADSRRENAELAAANHALNESLLRGKRARQMALGRIDALLERVRSAG